MKAKSYLDKRTELLPGTRASLFVTDGWRGGEEERRKGGGSGESGWSLHVLMLYERLNVVCVFAGAQAYRPHAEDICHYTDRQVWFLFSKCAFVN